MKIKFALLFPAATAMLSACAAPDGAYPSLAIREAERVTGTMQPVPPEPYAPPAIPAATLDAIERLASEAGQAHAAFQAEAPRTRAALATGVAGETGSDGWARAQVALAGLDAARSRTLISLADLDRLYVDAAVTGEEISVIEAARSKVLALVDEEDRMIASLAGALD